MSTAVRWAGSGASSTQAGRRRAGPGGSVPGDLELGLTGAGSAFDRRTRDPHAVAHVRARIAEAPSMVIRVA